MKNALLFICTILPLLYGCASKVPGSLKQAPESSPSLQSVQSQANNYQGVRVLWGGTIVQLENHPTSSHIEIVARALNKTGKPERGDQSEGRFIAHIEGFLDPAIYADGRALTVTGKILKIEERKLGQMQYTYPVVRVESHHLWPQEEEHHIYEYDPLFHDPWYPFGYPYYPYRYWPYY